MKKITSSVYYIGVNDHDIDLFEGQYIVPNGMAYNSYLVDDDLIAIFDTVDKRFFNEWLNNIKEILKDRKPHFLIISHMEPDHSANIIKFLEVYPDTYVIGNKKTFNMMKQFFNQEIAHQMVVDDGGFLNTGHHNFNFIFAPMVHWPEVMLTYEENEKLLFSADAFGKFGALDVEEEWACEARRYYFGIVGKYGAQVQNVLKKASALQIKKILPLHGPILEENLGYYLNLYNIWSSYKSEVDGVAIFYTSVYGHTKEAAITLKEKIDALGCPKSTIVDLAREDMAEAVEDAFKYRQVILATTTYNAGIFPFMQTFIEHLKERNYQNKTIGIIENGSWAPNAAKTIKEAFANSKNITFIEPIVTILSSLNDKNIQQIDELAKCLCEEYIKHNEIKISSLEPEALFNIGYGLYVVTSNDGQKDNGLIVNTVSQISDKPNRVAVNINKLNYSCSTIKTTKKLNVNCLSVDAPFDIFKKFGFISGRDANKFKGEEVLRSSNGLVVLSNYINAYFSIDVEQIVDLDTHLMFIGKVNEAKIMSNKETMTYSYYQKNVKPKPEVKKKGYVCKVCGYVYEEDNLPEDFVCPLCKHGASDFIKL